MPTEPANDADLRDWRMHEDEAMPSVSDQKVLDETARMAREGLKQLQSDPYEPKHRDRDERDDSMSSPSP